MEVMKSQTEIVSHVICVNTNIQNTSQTWYC